MHSRFAYDLSDVPLTLSLRSIALLVWSEQRKRGPTFDIWRLIIRGCWYFWRKRNIASSSARLHPRARSLFLLDFRTSDRLDGATRFARIGMLCGMRLCEFHRNRTIKNRKIIMRITYIAQWRRVHVVIISHASAINLL